MRKIVLGVLITSLVGCSMGHRDPVEIKQSLNQSINESNGRNLDALPPSVEADLMPDIEGVTPRSQETVKRFRIKANNVEAKAFFASLVKGTEFSAAIHPNVEGRVTVNLTDVTLDDVLSVVRDMYGFEITKKGKVIQVYPAGLRTVTIPVDYLQLKRTGRSLTSITTGTITNTDTGSNNNSNSSNSSNSSSNSNSSSSTTTKGGTEIETISESDFWPQLEKAVLQLIGSGQGQSVVVTPQASVITVRAYPDEIREVRNFLGISHDRMQRQVILEAKILEVTLSDGYQQGINWSKMFTSNGTNYTIGAGSIVKDVAGNILPAALPGLDSIGALLGGQSNVVISSGSFDAVLSFMGTQGDLNVLSSPRVTASNNQKAVIKVGADEYYVTDLSSVVGNGDNSNVAPEVELTPFFSGISLDVTPQIDDQGNVFLHVHPAVIEVEQQSKEIDYGETKIILPLAKSTIRESDSIIRAQDGDVVVIGGLMKSNNINQVSKVPFLGDIPALGHLFRNTSKITQKTELVILLKPTVVGVNTWQKELERSRELLQEWFPDEE
ncbi:pilus (MSHA type) biogenesis protein MshL [Vibrio aestuarianus]|uniref:Pilus (MSHA type) biogenesis protein MshL n=1 Tax=Vibrio aestuarianus TaxID=28171 RepID=A0A7X6N5M8_9VIBR|nr:pilus (MSHA type) biogenesis protein MshL [Vibrio aestuarianus]MDE1215060.1 pilus (MSHA type) biogenesis protein MshL [Vibrio aestuarianus]MDE1217949.1 pilus (MSHA type) biogenesis protein MshL [Vibrio aestuarianus]MDE1243403.1 pilus (MSHA type) biogenesis protein MshL [Vibrio aestuarianus]MDE1250627.1 pilus (MSHA type) biogenesis protein MshL [Vibrio aestuarianus]MDE1262162.1 pilus (MSHA type) biogenesis protein MshL [Vibrio aestuarianus]